jgi:major type 1 subunit fimbrin (pilin)
MAAHASDGTITFNGQLTGSTCSVSVAGQGADATVTLPTISATQLSAAAQTAGATSFAMQLSACTSTSNVQAFFEDGATVDHATGNLLNAATAGGATNVEVQLYDGKGAMIKAGDTSQTASGSYNVPIANGAATLYYGAQYYATDATTAGTVSSTVTYSISYL